MKDVQTIKERLKKIQSNFNPQKNTYKIIGHVVNNSLSCDEMLQELSKIKGFSKYPEELKQEYVSIINDIKENIIAQRKKEEQERQEANTKELKDIIDQLEKNKNEYLEKHNENPEPLKNKIMKKDNKEVKEELKTEKEVQDKVVKKTKNEVLSEDSKEEIKPNNENKININKLLIIGIALVIVITVLVILFY